VQLRRLDALIALSAFGVGIGTYLTYVALAPNVEAFCTGVGDCNRVQQSEYAHVAGIPVAILGLAMYVALLALTLARRAGMQPFGGDGTILRTWTFALAFAGMLYSGYLTYLELFVIDAICVWCVGSAVVVTVIAALSLPDARPSSTPDAR
jgi:uncharacterized membrane protein